MLEGVGFAIFFPFRGRGKYVLLAGALFFYGLSWVLPGLVAAAITWVLVCGYACKIIGESARGEDSPPDWPDVTESFGAVVMVLAAVLICLGPAGGLWILRGYAATDRLTWSILAVGLFFLPMVLLSLALHGSLAGLNPLRILPAIIRVLPAYLAMAVAFYAGVAGSGLLTAWIDDFPVIGSIISAAVSLYFLMFEMHLLGLLYRIHEKRIGWF
jgi:hypothetical protein